MVGVSCARVRIGHFLVEVPLLKSGMTLGLLITLIYFEANQIIVALNFFIGNLNI